MWCRNAFVLFTTMVVSHGKKLPTYHSPFLAILILVSGIVSKYPFYILETDNSRSCNNLWWYRAVSYSYLLDIYFEQIYHVWEGYLRKIPVERRTISRAERLVFFANTPPNMIHLFDYTEYYLEHWLNK
jgi:hypothetical protein